MNENDKHVSNMAYTYFIIILCFFSSDPIRSDPGAASKPKDILCLVENATTWWVELIDILSYTLT